MTDTERERQRIVSIIAVLRDQAIRDYARNRQNDADMGLALIGTYQECIDKIMEVADE